MKHAMILACEYDDNGQYDHELVNNVRKNGYHIEKCGFRDKNGVFQTTMIGVSYLCNDGDIENAKRIAKQKFMNDNPHAHFA